MRSRHELEIVKNFVDSTYTHFGNKLIVDTNKVYDPEHTKLGFCFKHIRSPFSKPLMMLILSSFFGLKAKQEQGFLAYGVQPKTMYQNFRDEVNAVLEKIL